VDLSSLHEGGFLSCSRREQGKEDGATTRSSYSATTSKSAENVTEKKSGEKEREGEGEKMEETVKKEGGEEKEEREDRERREEKPASMITSTSDRGGEGNIEVAETRGMEAAPEEADRSSTDKAGEEHQREKKRRADECGGQDEAQQMQDIVREEGRMREGEEGGDGRGEKVTEEERARKMARTETRPASDREVTEGFEPAAGLSSNIGMLRDMANVVSAMSDSSLIGSASHLKDIVTTLQHTQQRAEKAEEDRRKWILENRRCKVCWERESNILLLPCSQLCVCDQCVRHISVCPLCSEPVTDGLQLDNFVQ